ncbi:MAG TPA: hypothetical protein VMP68_03715 [Candidatus Eisenbacteria bacterium]|nr:hypothetical protein [Candidatus Eisenbacteria bacterium]
MLKKITFMLLLISTLTAESRPQEPTPKPTTNAQKIRWHKYVNKEFGFSIKYPDSYRPIADPEYCKDNDYRRWLLCLGRRDDPNATIMVTIVMQGPFFIKTNRGGNEYTPRQIGQHLFYCGLQGSMGVGFSDECTFNLRGRVLELSFSPAETINSGVEINPLMFKSLKTFRTF